MAYNGNFSSIFASGNLRTDYQVSATSPTVRSDTSPLQPGDFWLDTINNLLYFRNLANSAWTRVSNSLRAAVVFNAVPGTIVPSLSFGVTSVTKSGMFLTVNFAAGVFANTNYVMAGSMEDAELTTTDVYSFYKNPSSAARTTTSTTFRCVFSYAYSGSGIKDTNFFLPPRVELAFFGGN